MKFTGVTYNEVEKLLMLAIANTDRKNYLVTLRCVTPLALKIATVVFTCDWHLIYYTCMHSHKDWYR